MSDYEQVKKSNRIPRLPLNGSIDITYRCNNNCRHCWLRIPSESAEKERELTLDEIKGLIDDARKMGCHQWSMSGGEPMLRSDFGEIFDYITMKSVSYSLNTNGTLITPKIAKLLRRKGNKMVVLYGATAEMHDHITRNPGSFEATMRGFSYLKEAGVGFTVQLVPMKDNYNQFDEMIQLAKSLSPLWRVGAPWLYLSACGDMERNIEIKGQRLSPKDVVDLDKPDVSYEEWIEKEETRSYFHYKDLQPTPHSSQHEIHNPKEDNRLFASCIAERRDFHIDPYGQMTFCSFIKEPSLLYDLMNGSFKECWEEFIPSLADKVRGGREYLENCGSCELRGDCRWCPVYGYLEHRRFSAKVEYLCAIARENREFKQNWKENNRRYYQIAGITIQVDSDLAITDGTFHPKFKPFQVDGPGEESIYIRHHFSLPEIKGRNLGVEVYRKPPWAIFRKGNSWIYLGISSISGDKHIHRVAVFNHDHTRARIYNNREETFLNGDLHSLTLFSTDQILLARVLAYREGCYLHSSGVVFEDKGFVFVGHSEAGKSTIVKMLKDKAEVLCDDRIIVRKSQDGFRIYGTWSHGEVEEVSARSAHLSAIMFLEKAQENRLKLLIDKKEIIRRLLACLIKPFVTTDWWDKMLSLVEKMTHEVPCYILQFDKSGKVVDLLKRLHE